MAHSIRPGDSRVDGGTVDQALEEGAVMWGGGSTCQVETSPICRHDIWGPKGGGKDLKVWGLDGCKCAVCYRDDPKRSVEEGATLTKDVTLQSVNNSWGGRA